MPVPDVDTLSNHHFRLTIGKIIVIAACVSIFFFILFPDVRTEIAFASAVIGGAATVYGAHFAATALRVNLACDRQARSFAILDHLNERQSAELRVFLESEVIDKDLSGPALYEKITNTPQRLANVSAVLGLYEDISIAIQESFADERSLYRSLSHIIPWTYNNLRNYIEEARTKNNEPRLYIEVERLVSSWKSQKFLESNQPIPNDL